MSLDTLNNTGTDLGKRFNQAEIKADTLMQGLQELETSHLTHDVQYLNLADSWDPTKTAVRRCWASWQYVKTASDPPCCPLPTRGGERM